MTKEEKQLLLQDLCARLPYEVKVEYRCFHDGKDLGEVQGVLTGRMLDSYKDNIMIGLTEVHSITPYLRPLATMTDEEAKEFDNISESITIVNYQQVTPSHYNYMIKIEDMKKVSDWFAKKHFDTVGLIEQGLALEAPEGMYNGFQRHDL